MKPAPFFISIIGGLVAFGISFMATAQAIDGVPTAGTQAVDTPIVTNSLTALENTLPACKDKMDNDQDGHVDCEDQDCDIYAICVVPKNSPVKAAQSVADSSNSNQVDTVKIFERGRLCKDGIDNDNDGHIDCHDSVCQTTRHCQKIMYEYPKNPHKAPGPFFQVGAGLAFPNFNWKKTRVDSQYGTRIPFDPDMGGMLNFKVGVLPIPWLGFGMNAHIGGTFATNRADFLSLADLDTKYKYDGYKVFGHLGGFVRLQYPVGRVVPYMDIAVGYSFARYKWRIYDANESWDDISSDWDDSDWSDDSNSRKIPHDTRYRQGDHLSLVLEPGVDVYIVDKTVAIGGHAWIPVASSGSKGMDNIGLLFNVTFTPNWREPKKLKEEYEN